MALLCPSACGALCCRYITIEIDPPHKGKVNRDEARWILFHENTHLLREDTSWYVQVDVHCENLTEDQRCAVYHDRPDVCREYETEGCDYFGEANEKTVFISTVEEWEEFLAERDRKKKSKKKKGKKKGKRKK